MSDYADDFDTPRGRTSSSRRPAQSDVRASIPSPDDSASQLTPEQKAVVQELKQANKALRLELLDLNRELDTCLELRGQRAGRVPPLPRASTASAADQLILKNERNRKRNHELLSKLHQADGLERITDLRNSMGKVSGDADVLRGENRSLENVFAHQMVSLRVTLKVEEDLAKERQEHLEYVRGLKEQMRVAREAKEAHTAVFRDLSKHIDRIEEKVRVQNDIGDSVRTVEDIRQHLEAKDRTIDALKYQVTVLSRTNVSDQKRSRIVSTRLSAELHSLRSEAEELRQQLASFGVEKSLQVDTRI